MQRRYWQEIKSERWTWATIVSVAGILLLVVTAILISVMAFNSGYEPPDVRGTYPSSRGSP